MRIQGEITQVLPLQQGLSQTGKQWRKQTIVVKQGDDVPFPDEVALDLFNDKIPETPLVVGQRVDVHFGIRTREYNGRVYNEVNVVRMRKVEN